MHLCKPGMGFRSQARHRVWEWRTQPGNSVTFKIKRESLGVVEDLASQRVPMHKAELVWVPETEQCKDTAPVWWDSLVCAGAIG